MFEGFFSSLVKTQIVQNSGGLIEFETSEAGKILIEIPKLTYSKAQQVDVSSEKSAELDQEFGSHPYTAGMKKFDGALKVILGKTPPAQTIQVCFDRTQVFKSKSSDEIFPLVYWYYDEGEETLSQFTKPDQISKDKLECLLVMPSEFSNLDNKEERFETVILFAKKEQAR